MEGGPAPTADPASGEPTQQLLARDIEEDDAIQTLSPAMQQGVELPE